MMKGHQSLFLVAVMSLSACGAAQFKTISASGVIPEPQQTADLVVEAKTEEMPILDDLVIEQEDIVVQMPEKLDKGEAGKEKAPIITACVNIPVNCRSLPGVTLQPDVVLQNLNLMYGDFKLQNLARAQLLESNMQQSCGTGSEFSDADLRNINLYQSSYAQTNFSRADIEHANLQESDFSQSNFSDARLKHSNLHQSCIENSNFSRVSFSGHTNACHLKAARSNFSSGHIHSHASFCYADFQGANLSAIRIDDAVDFSHANFRGANLSGAVISAQVNFSNADFTGAIWIDGQVCGEGSIGGCRL